MALYTIRIGSNMAAPDFEFTRSDFRGLPQLSTALDIINSELAVDELRFEVDWDSGAYVWFSPKDYDGVMTSDGYMFATADTTAELSAVPYGTPVWLLENGALRVDPLQKALLGCLLLAVVLLGLLPQLSDFLSR